MNEQTREQATPLLCGLDMGLPLRAQGQTLVTRNGDRITDNWQAIANVVNQHEELQARVRELEAIVSRLATTSQALERSGAEVTTYHRHVTCVQCLREQLSRVMRERDHYLSEMNKARDRCDFLRARLNTYMQERVR